MRVLCLTNVTGSSQALTLPIEDSDLDGDRWIDLLSDFAISLAEGKFAHHSGALSGHVAEGAIR